MNVVPLRAPETAQEPDHAEAMRIAEALLFAAAFARDAPKWIEFIKASGAKPE